MAQKLIVTLWRGQLNQLDLQQKSQPIICRVNYANQSRKSKKADTKKGMVWKQTFIFNLRKDPQIQTDVIKLDFIKLQQNQQIHFAEQIVAQSIAFAVVQCKQMQNIQQKGHCPLKHKFQMMTVEPQEKFSYNMRCQRVKLLIWLYDEDKRFSSYFLTKFKAVKIGDKQYKEDFAFDQQGGIFTYNYPLKIYVKKETEMDIILQIKDYYGKDYYDDSYNSYMTDKTQKSKSNVQSKAKDKNPLDINVDRLTAIMDLNFKKNTSITKKLPLTIPVKSGKREIGAIQFNIEAFFRTKQQMMQLEEQRRADIAQRQAVAIVKPQGIQKKKKYQVPKNGVITVNSIIAKMEPFNEQSIEGRDFSLQVKIGKQVQYSSTLQDPGKQLIFIDTFNFKRTWQENMKLTILVHNQNGQKLPSFFTQVSLRDLYQIGRFLAKRLPVRDQRKNHCGQMIIDVVYVEQVKEKKEPLKQDLPYGNGPIKTVQQVLKQKRQLKRKQIQERLKKKQQEKLERQQQKKLKNSFDLSNSIPTFPEEQLMLPPLRTRRNSPTTATNTTNTTSTISPKGRKLNFLYNKGGSISFSKSPRFNGSKDEQHDSYLFNRPSDFDTKKKRGPSIGVSDRFDFTKNAVDNPGAGRYQIPTLWDKYRQ